LKDTITAAVGIAKLQLILVPQRNASIVKGLIVKAAGSAYAKKSTRRTQKIIRRSGSSKVTIDLLHPQTQLETFIPSPIIHQQVLDTQIKKEQLFIY
jgi:hypothetical protein